MPHKTPLRFAADAAFHLLNAERAAKRAAEGASDPDARRLAKHVMAGARVMRKHAERLEKDLIA